MPRGSSHHLTPIDEAQVELTFANGCRASLRAHWGSAARKEDRCMTAELHDNETWTIDFRAESPTVTSPPASPAPTIPTTLPLPHSTPGIQQDALSLQLASFLEASRHRAVPRVTSGEGHAALSLAQQIRQRILDNA